MDLLRLLRSNRRCDESLRESFPYLAQQRASQSAHPPTRCFVAPPKAQNPRPCSASVSRNGRRAFSPYSWRCQKLARMPEIPQRPTPRSHRFRTPPPPAHSTISTTTFLSCCACTSVEVPRPGPDFPERKAGGAGLTDTHHPLPICPNWYFIGTRHPEVARPKGRATQLQSRIPEG